MVWFGNKDELKLVGKNKQLFAPKLECNTREHLKHLSATKIQCHNAKKYRRKMKCDWNKEELLNAVNFGKDFFSTFFFGRETKPLKEPLAAAALRELTG